MGDGTMKANFGDFRYKEVINITDGCRYGCPTDAVIDLETGQVAALVIPGRLRLFGLLGREVAQTFPWSSVRQIGEDIILVEGQGKADRHG